MIHQTKGIVLRTIKYGETSVVVNIFTELFGIQSYMVNGVRTSGKTSKAIFFQPASILEMEVYHNELKNLQRIKEFKWNFVYRNVLSDVTKNSVALYMVELLQKCLKQPEQNAPLFAFIEDAFIHLDKADDAVVGNFPLFFALHLTVFFGFRIEDVADENENKILDLQEGIFTSIHPSHSYYIEGMLADITSQILRVMQPGELSQLKLNQSTRRLLLQAYEDYYRLHLPEFGRLKSLPILQELLS
jgi:DNA repair protein RecO (recombination protein O)